MPQHTLREKRKIIRNFRRVTNMTASDLDAWSDSACSNEASLSRAPVRRNIRLLRKPVSQWTARDFDDAQRTVSFVNRMSGISPGDPVSESCPVSPRDISLMNWAHRPSNVPRPKFRRIVNRKFAS